MARVYNVANDPILAGLKALDQGVGDSLDRQLRKKQYEAQFGDIKVTPELLSVLPKEIADPLEQTRLRGAQDAYESGAAAPEISVPRQNFELMKAFGERKAAQQKERLAAQEKGFDYQEDPVTGELKAVPIPGFKKPGPDAELEALRKLNLRTDIDLKTAKAETEANKAATGPKLTDSQANAAGFAKRIEQSEQIFNDLSKSGYDPTTMGAAASRMLPEYFKPGQLKQQEQAERNFINAVLRRESGAAISPSEFQSAEKQYFPRAGDPPEVLAQKLANRQQVLESLKTASGPAYERVKTVSIEKPKINNSQLRTLKSQALDAIKRQPDRAEEIRRQFKEMTEEDLG